MRPGDVVPIQGKQRIEMASVISVAIIAAT
jgi:hypothetical protein